MGIQNFVLTRNGFWRQGTPSTTLNIPTSVWAGTASIQTALLNHNILADDQPMGRHLPQFRQSSIHMLVGIDKRDYDGQLASGFDEMRGVDFAAPKKTGHRVEGDRSKNIFFTQVLQDRKMQRARWCQESPSVR